MGFNNFDYNFYLYIQWLGQTLSITYCTPSVCLHKITLAMMSTPG